MTECIFSPRSLKWLLIRKLPASKACLIVRYPVSESHFCGLTRQVCQCMFHGFQGGGGVMFSILCSPKFDLGGRRTHSVSALLLVQSRWCGRFSINPKRTMQMGSIQTMLMGCLWIVQVVKRSRADVRSTKMREIVNHNLLLTTRLVFLYRCGFCDSTLHTSDVRRFAGRYFWHFVRYVPSSWIDIRGTGIKPRAENFIWAYDWLFHTATKVWRKVLTLWHWFGAYCLGSKNCFGQSIILIPHPLSRVVPEQQERSVAFLRFYVSVSTVLLEIWHLRLLGPLSSRIHRVWRRCHWNR